MRAGLGDGLGGTWGDVGVGREVEAPVEMELGGGPQVGCARIR
ncbi:hypothetical protein ABN034_03570 [Actinopolymorpha sp. B11F2]